MLSGSTVREDQELTFRRVTTSERLRVEEATLSETGGRNVWRARANATQLRQAATWVVVTWIVTRVLAVDITAIASNDSLGYVTRGKSPFGRGFIVQGYRQVGYPIYLWFNDRLASIVDWDRLFAVALVQRAVLLGGVLLLWRSLRWWSLPMLAFVLAPTYVVHADLLLNEGLLIPGSLLYVACVAAVFRHLDSVQTHASRWAIVLFALPVALATMKLQYASYLALSLAATWLLVGDGLVTKRLLKQLVGAVVVILSLLCLVQSIENHRETGVFEPVSEQARADWYGSYQIVFTLAPENRERPELAQYFADGDLYTFLHGIEAAEPSYVVRRSLIDDRVEAMFEAAGMSRREQQLRSVWGALGGGRMDDLTAIIDGALAGERPRYGFNRLRNDPERALLITNDGEEAGRLSVGPLVEISPSPIDDHREWKAVYGYGAFGVLAISLVVPGRHRYLAAATLLSALAGSVVLGGAFIDNARYLLGPITVTGVSALIVLSMIAHLHLPKASNPSS